MRTNPDNAVHSRTTNSLDLRTTVARRMLADELAKVPHRFDDAWAEEAEAWLRNADSAVAVIADELAKLRSALRPFATAADYAEVCPEDVPYISNADLYTARRALEESEA